MKKLILALTTAAVAGTGVQTASAGGHGGGCGWSTAGSVLAGVTAGVVIGSALAPRPAYYVAPARVTYPAPGYGYAYTYAAPPTPVVYAPPPRVVYTAPAPVVVYRQPVCVAPPTVSVGFGWSSGCRGYSVRVGGGW